MDSPHSSWGNDFSGVETGTQLVLARWNVAFVNKTSCVPVSTLPGHVWQCAANVADFDPSKAPH